MCAFFYGELPWQPSTIGVSVNLFAVIFENFISMPTPWPSWNPSIWPLLKKWFPSAVKTKGWRVDWYVKMLVLPRRIKICINISKNFTFFSMSQGLECPFLLWIIMTTTNAMAGPVTGIGRPGLKGKSGPPLPSAASRTEGAKRPSLTRGVRGHAPPV